VGGRVVSRRFQARNRRDRRLQVSSILKIFFVMLAGISVSTLAQEPGRDYGRSMVVNQLGIVATSQTLASQAGADILRRGGNAVDAAIAANAVLSVAEPMMNGIGGDLFAIVYVSKERKLYGLNASGWSGRSSTIDGLKERGITGKIPGRSVHSVTVPGAVAGWQALHDKFGKLPLPAILAPAIYYASEGVPVAELVSKVWASAGQPFVTQPGFAAVFMPAGHAPSTGQVFRDGDLAGSLRSIAAQGANAFYRGVIAEKMVAFLKEQGSFLDAEDFAQYQPEWVEPLSTTYRGWKVYELPPNGQGIAALLMLNIMEKFPLGQYGSNSAEALHVMIEAKKLAYADLQRYIGDPRFAGIPVSELLSKDLASERARLIENDRASCGATPSDVGKHLARVAKDTTYLTAVDSDGNIVSLIQSNSGAFGTGLVAPGTGFALQNRGALFSLDANSPNALGPRKRPLHTIIPAFMEKGDARIGFGIMGGFNQPQAHAQFVANVVDFGMNIQAALDAARFTKLTFEGCDVMMESRIPADVRQKLSAKGHKISVLNGYSANMGRGNAVMIDGSGVKYGASDPRGDGEAIPQAPRLRTE
jgi:gamma-glutamyltranspeptidase / glutathione hydrolase